MFHVGYFTEVGHGDKRNSAVELGEMRDSETSRTAEL